MLQRVVATRSCDRKLCPLLAKVQDNNLKMTLKVVLHTNLSVISENASLLFCVKSEMNRFRSKLN